MAKLTKKEFYGFMERLLDNMEENKDFREEFLSKFLDREKNVNELILESSPSDFFQNYKINQIQENLRKVLDATRIKNLVNNEHSCKVAIDMKKCEVGIMDNNSYEQNKDVHYFSLPSLKDYENDNLSEIRISLKNGYHPILDVNDNFYLESALKDTFEELKIDREDKEQEIEEEDNSNDFDR